MPLTVSDSDPAPTAQDGMMRMFVRDVLGEALSAPLSRPGRALLTALGTVLGVSLFVLTLGLTASTDAAVNSDFNALVSTEVDATASPSAASTMVQAAQHGGIQRLRGVVAAGVLMQLPSATTVTHFPRRPEDIATDGQIAVDAASPGALQVIAPHLVRGRVFDRDEEAAGAHVALVGGAAAEILEMRHAKLPWWVDVGGMPFLVEGVIGKTRRHADTLLDVVVPYKTAQVLPGAEGVSPEVIVATGLGYAEAVAAALPPVLYPREPGAIRAASLPQPAALRARVNGNLTALFVILAGVGMIVGGVGITNAAVVAVMERVAEIGVRRALGARKRQIAMQFMLENLAIGTIGGFLGVCLGILALTAVSVANGWTPVLPIWVVVLAPLAGSLTGLVAGVYPAVRAANLDPVAALAR